MVNVVEGLFAFANVPPPLVVHPLNTWPAGGVFAEIVTCVPAAKLPPPEPFTTVSAWVVGAPVVGVTELEAAEAGPVPTAFVAVTVNVYAVPLVKPVTVIGLVVPVAVMLPGLEVTVKPVIGLPPLLVGAVNVTVADALPAVAVTAVGAPGTVTGVTVSDTFVLLPTAFTARTLIVTGVPLVRPVTTWLVASSTSSHAPVPT